MQMCELACHKATYMQKQLNIDAKRRKEGWRTCDFRLTDSTVAHRAQSDPQEWDPLLTGTSKNFQAASNARWAQMQ